MADKELISTHVPRAGDDNGDPRFCSFFRNFTPRPPCGRRLAFAFVARFTNNFNPRPPCGRRQEFNPRPLLFRPNFNPRPPCGRRLERNVPASSIVKDFNPRPPCGRRRLIAGGLLGLSAFQPTSPVRETTGGVVIECSPAFKFQPTSPVRETTLLSADQKP